MLWWCLLHRPRRVRDRGGAASVLRARILAAASFGCASRTFRFTSSSARTAHSHCSAHRRHCPDCSVAPFGSAAAVSGVLSRTFRFSGCSVRSAQSHLAVHQLQCPDRSFAPCSSPAAVPGSLVRTLQFTSCSVRIARSHRAVDQLQCPDRSLAPCSSPAAVPGTSCHAFGLTRRSASIAHLDSVPARPPPYPIPRNSRVFEHNASPCSATCFVSTSYASPENSGNSAIPCGFQEKPTVPRPKRPLPSSFHLPLPTFSERPTPSTDGACPTRW